MAVEKEKVLPVLEAKLKGKGYPKTFVDSLAAKMAAKIDTDDDIETYVEDRVELLVEADKEADRRATAAATKAAEKAKEAGKEPKEEPKEDELPDDTPAWAKTLIENNKALEAKLKGFEQAQSQKSIAERFKSHEKLKGIPELLFKGRIPQTEEDFEAAVEELATDFESLAKEQNITRFGNDKPGGAGHKPEGGKKQASKEEIDALAAKMNLT